METTDQIEEFRDIPGWPGYQVSNQGRIRNANNLRLRSLSQYGGYKMVTLHGPGVKPQTLRVHRLVLLAFIGLPPRSCRTVDHIDRDPSNNTLENLRYATAQEQRRNQVQRPSQKNSRRVEGIRDDGSVVVYDSVLRAAEAVNGTSGAFCNYIKRGRPYRGYRWRYIVEHNDDIWKDIPPPLIGGQTGYAASEGGLIRFRNGRITPGSSLNGYRYVSINNKSFLVHRLIAGTYLTPAAAEQTIVNHRDGNRSNNKLENLEFVTQAENIQHAHRTGLVASQGRRIKQFTLQGEFVREFRNAYEAGRIMGKSYSSFHLCCRGETKTAHGFIWSYSVPAQTDSQA